MQEIIKYESEAKYEQEFKENLNECKREFNLTFNNNNNEENNICCVAAPGRVNLIGEHIDYNDGYVLPMAIPLYTIIIGSLNNSNSNRQCRIKSLESSLGSNNYVEFNLDDLKPQTDVKFKWANYLLGVVANFKGNNKNGFDAVIKSNVPLGSGLSSSAALEVAMYTFLENISNEFSDKKEKALACQKAEHEYAGVPCGIMDQFISTLGVKNHALLIDCKTYESKEYAINDPNVAVLIINSNVKHQLEGSEYSSRRKQCESVTKLLNKSFRDISLDDLLKNKNSIDDESFRRARHAVTEIQRTTEAVNALQSNDLHLFGKLMNESHNSLRDDFNVSCKELDELVEICRAQSGVYGSRMTGGGFGGCTVTLVNKENIKQLIQNVEDNYSGRPSFYVCSPVEGARKVE